MPAEWDTYLERMGAEEANAPYEPIHAIFGVEGL